jgi:hypothetical protein
MASLDIFNNDAFSLQSMTLAITSAPHKPGRLGELGLFDEEGINTTFVSVEKEGESLVLVPAGVRGSVARPVAKTKRQMVNFAAIHLPQTGGLNADEIQNVRAFGSETEMQSVQTLVNKDLAKQRMNIDVTLEYQRLGALRGQVLDADGVTVLNDLYTAFGVTQQVQGMALATAATKVRTKIVAAKRKMDAALGNLPYSAVRGLCSASFFDAFVDHADVNAAFDRYNQGEFKREDLRQGFMFGGVYWEEYRGAVNGTDFIAAGEAYMYPEGVPNLFKMYFAPADYMETVNTNGLPYYAKQEPRKMGKGVDTESQSNPLTLCTRPAVIVKLTAA